MTTFLDRLTQAMAEANKTKTDLWKACDISSGAVSQWFSKPTTQLKGKNLLCVARELGVNPEWLATGTGDKYKNVEAERQTTIKLESVTGLALTKEQQQTLELMGRLDKEARDVLLKMGNMLARRLPERRKKNTGHDPERRWHLGPDIPPDAIDTSEFRYEGAIDYEFDPEEKSEQQRKRKE